MTVPFSATVATASAEQTESRMYRSLLGQVLLPHYALLEASLNPLPAASVIFRKNSESGYQKAKLTPSSNLVESLLAGFEEPYAFALFLGNVVDFSQGVKTLGHKRKGYMGYLISYGNYHILESQLIPDSWVETEMKIKGDLVTEQRKMAWSFRVGNKAHSSPEIADSLYFGIKRDRIDYTKRPLSFLLSSGVDFRADFRQGDLKLLGHSVLIEKNLPFKTRKREIVFSLGAGYKRLSREKYSGSLAGRRERPETIIIMRPNLKF